MSTHETEVLIIGAGGAGTSAALHLAQRGVACVLLERGLVGGQASGVNYGGVRQQGRHPAELPIARRSMALWHKLKDITGTDAEFTVSGHLKLARTPEEEADLVAYLEVARDNDLPLRFVGRNALHEDYPWLGPKVIAGSLAPEDGAANPRLMVPALAHAARAAGAVIHENTKATRYAFDGEWFEVTTGTHTFRASWLLNTAGFWGGAVAEAFGEKTPVSALNPNMMVTEPIRYFIEPNLGVVGGNVYLRQIPRGNVIIGGGYGVSDPAVPWSRPKAEETRAAMALAADLVPELKGISIIRSWTGIDGEMPDHIPVIGPSRTTPRLLHAFGFSGHGFQLGPAVGAILSELVLDGHTDVPLEPFDIGRWTQQAA